MPPKKQNKKKYTSTAGSKPGITAGIGSDSAIDNDRSSLCHCRFVDTQDNTINQAPRPNTRITKVKLGFWT